MILFSFHISYYINVFKVLLFYNCQNSQHYNNLGNDVGDFFFGPDLGKACRSETLIQSDFFYRDSSASITSAMRSQPDSPSNSVVIEDEPEVIEDQNKGKSKVRKNFVKGCRI